MTVEQLVVVVVLVEVVVEVVVHMMEPVVVTGLATV
jgi:hypothetical protein